MNRKSILNKKLTNIINMYPIISRLSFIIRIWICYMTIEQFPIFANKTIEWIFGQIISIYTILWLICYIIVGIISDKHTVKGPTQRSIIYFCLYLILVVVSWLILWVLTKLGILPI